jgi:hypothetical protein
MTIPQDPRITEVIHAESLRLRTEKMMANVPPKKMRKPHFQNLRDHLIVSKLNNAEKMRKLKKELQ